MATLHNDHNVYVLGAGFSAARGIPVISSFTHFLRDAHEWLEEQGRAADVRAIGNVLDFRQKATPAAYRVKLDLENIEELFSLAAAIGDELAQDICRSIAATIEYSERRKPVPMTSHAIQSKSAIPELPEAILDPKLKEESGPGGLNASASTYNFALAAMLGKLDAPKKRATNSIISFNYDLVVEDALTDLGISFSYGFGPKSYALHESSKRFLLRRTADVPLLKLHGSINWAYPGRRLGKLTVHGSYRDVRELGLVPQLVPPTWRKTFDGALSHVWDEALRRISTATRLIVLGFSMPPTDLHFKYLMAAGLRENLSLREIVFVDQNPGAVKERAEQMFGELTRRPIVRIVHSDIMQFLTQGHLESAVWSVGRTLHPQIQHVTPSW